MTTEEQKINNDVSEAALDSAVAERLSAKEHSKRYFEAVGRRKRAVARIRIFTVNPKDSAAEGNFTVNEKKSATTFLMNPGSRKQFLNR